MGPTERPILREIVGELLGSGALVAVAIASGAVRVQLGAGTMPGALLGSVALGLGYGLVLWSFARLSGVQTNPLVSVAASLFGGQPWRRTFARAAAQLIGAGAAGFVVAKIAPFTIIKGTELTKSPLLAEAVTAFGFLLVALGVAHRRNVMVPVALGAFATASFWMSGRATVGNPLLSLTVLLVMREAAPPMELLATTTAATVGSFLALLTARFLFPHLQDAAGALLFAPNGGKR